VLSETSKRGFAWRSSPFSSALPTNNPTAGTLPVRFFCPLKGRNTPAEPLQCVPPSPWNLYCGVNTTLKLSDMRFVLTPSQALIFNHHTTTPPHRLSLMQPGPKGVSHAARIGDKSPTQLHATALGGVHGLVWCRLLDQRDAVS
jgi:hypothetical protein